MAELNILSSLVPSTGFDGRGPHTPTREDMVEFRGKKVG